MNPAERKLLDKLDRIVMDASRDDLREIQEVDLQTQLEGRSFYDAFMDSKALVNQNIKKESNDSK